MSLLNFFKKNKRSKETENKIYKREFKIAGVTSENIDGTPRQNILQAIIENKRPFHKKLDVEIKPYALKGIEGMAVIVNRQIIGNISSKDLPFFENNKDRLLGISNIYIGKNSQSYYAKIKVAVQTK